MSRKLRNTIRDANMRNFSCYTIERYLIIDDDRNNDEKDQFVKKSTRDFGVAFRKLMLEPKVLFCHMLL